MTKTSFSRVQTVFDVSLKASSDTFAVHAFSSDTTVFLTGAQIATYLRSLESEEIKIHEIDFTQIKNESSLAALKAPSSGAAPASTEKDLSKVEGPIQIGILYKKEVDFAGWYTDVLPCHYLST